MKPKHTPGPWILLSGMIVSGEKHSTVICGPREHDAYDSGYDFDEKHWKANSKIIVSSLDLLTALEDILPYAETALSALRNAESSREHYCEKAIRKAQDAIKKAKGEK